MSEKIKNILALRWIFKYVDAQGACLLHHENKSPLGFDSQAPPRLVDEIMKAKIKEHDGAKPSEYVLQTSNLHVDPGSGWAIQGAKLVKQSLIDVYAHHQRLSRPSFVKYVAKRL